MRGLQAIETVYRDYRFRSRLEARWAVFFDTLNIPYEYEKEGYDLDGVWYLPDFWLPEQDCWIEIKGKPGNDEAEQRAVGLVWATMKSVYVFYGPILDPYKLQIGDIYQFGYDVSSAHWIYRDSDDDVWELAGDYGYLWCECSTCSKLGIEFDGRSDRLPCKRCGRCSNIIHRAMRGPVDDECYIHGKELDLTGCPCSEHGNKGYNYDSPRLLSAYRAARSARFERRRSYG